MSTDTVAGLLLERRGDHRPGLRSGDSSWCWDEVIAESAARADLARGLHRDGHPFHVGVLLENVPEFVFWLGGAALCGATIVGINSTKRGQVLAAEIRHADVELIVTDATGVALLEGLELGLAADRFLLTDTPGYADRLAAADREPRPAPEVDATTQFLLLFTSGTTGAAKAARCSQGRLTALARANAAKYDIDADDVSYCSMPLFHGNAIMALWAPSLAVGACVALSAKFSASRFLPDVRHHGATYFTYVGKVIGYVLGTTERSDDADNPLTHGFGTEASPEDQAEFARRFGARLYEGYGSSEGAGMVRLDPDGPPAALGRPAHEGVRIVDPETRETCPPAEQDRVGRVTNAEQAVGEMVNTTGAAAFEGYYNNAAADAERVRHGWYWTGDLGYVDAAGYLYFAGRSGDWIRVDGENISALLTERILRRHPRILAAGVFAVPDPRSGDQVMAAIEVASGTTFAELELPAFLAQQPDLGTKGAPRFVRVSTELPTTGSGKLRKKEMQVHGWRTVDDVHRWAGRGDPHYRLMSGRDADALRAEFEVNGRLRFLPDVAARATL